MYDHPLATYSSIGDKVEECNAWGFASGLTHSYFEIEDPHAGLSLLAFLKDSAAPGSYYRALIRDYKKFKTIAVLREIQCLVATAIEENESSADLEPFVLP
jgi:hypothetical protein